jgi:hypothetical protein
VTGGHSDLFIQPHKLWLNIPKNSTCSTIGAKKKKHKIKSFGEKLLKPTTYILKCAATSLPWKTALQC